MCTVKCIAPVPYFPSFLKTKRYSLYRKIPLRESINGLEVYHPRFLIIPKILRSLYGFLFFISLFGFFKRFIREFKPDILLGFWAYPDGFGNNLFGRILGVPVLVGCLGSDINRSTKYVSLRRLIAWSLKNADKVLVVSDSLRKNILKLGLDDGKIKVIPNGVDSGIFYPMPKERVRKSLGLDLNKEIILYVGRLSQEKGVDVLVKAFYQKNRVKDRTLLLVGDGPLKKTLASIVKEIRLNGDVQFVGIRPYDKIPEWINAADLVCLPSLSEGWPNVLMEALACGKPVVASRVGGVPEIITEDKLGLMVRPGRPYELAKAIAVALKKSWDTHFIRKHVERRTWGVVAEEIYNEITNVLENVRCKRT